MTPVRVSIEWSDTLFHTSHRVAKKRGTCCAIISVRTSLRMSFPSMAQLTEKHFYKYIKCPLWLYFDVHSEEKKLHDPLVERLIDDGLLREAEKEIIKDKKYTEVEVDDLEQAFAQTLELMRQGEQTIYHGVLVNGSWVARPDLLERVEGRSRFGDYYYVAVDIKQGRRVRAEYKFQGTFYAELLKLIQGTKPVRGYVITPKGHIESYMIEEFESEFHLTLDEIERIMAGQKPPHFVSTSCKQSPWFEQCKLEAEECNDVSLINRIYESEIRALKDAGINTVSALSKINLVDLEKKVPSLSTDRLVFLRDQAVALIQNKHIVRQAIEFSESDVELYFDIESDPLRDLHYLFGVLEVQDGKSKYHSFVAAKPEEEEKAWRGFLEYISSRRDVPIYHWGWYELDVVRRLAEKYGADEALIQNIEQNLVDLLSVVRDAVILPLYFYSLKDVAKYLGFSWHKAEATGLQSVIWYEQYLTNRRKKSILNDIIEYNEDDVRATWHVKKWAEGLEVES